MLKLKLTRIRLIIIVQFKYTVTIVNGEHTFTIENYENV